MKLPPPSWADLYRWPDGWRVVRPLTKQALRSAILANSDGRARTAEEAIEIDWKEEESGKIARFILVDEMGSLRSGLKVHLYDLPLTTSAPMRWFFLDSARGDRTLLQNSGLFDDKWRGFLEQMVLPETYDPTIYGGFAPVNWPIVLPAGAYEAMKSSDVVEGIKAFEDEIQRLEVEREGLTWESDSHLQSDQRDREIEERLKELWHDQWSSISEFITRTFADTDDDGEAMTVVLGTEWIRVRYESGEWVLSLEDQDWDFNYGDFLVKRSSFYRAWSEMERRISKEPKLDTVIVREENIEAWEEINLDIGEPLIEQRTYLMLGEIPPVLWGLPDFRSLYWDLIDFDPNAP